MVAPLKVGHAGKRALGAILGVALCFCGVARADAPRAALTTLPAAPPPPPEPGDPIALPPPPPEPPSTGGDAEPAPVSSNIHPDDGEGSDSSSRNGHHRIAFGARFAYRLGDAGQTISPSVGYGIVGSYDFTYTQVAHVLDLALGVDFSSDRFAATEQGVSPQSGAYGSTRVLSENEFVLAQTFSLRAGPMRPFVTLGLGLGVGSFQSVAPQYQGQETDTHLLGRAALGLDISIGAMWSVCVRGDYTAVRRAASYVTDAGLTLPLFGDLLDINLAAVYRF